MPDAGRLPIEDYDEDEEERLVEVEPTLADRYEKAHLDYAAAYARYQEAKDERDDAKAALLEALGNETATATVAGNRRLSVRVSPTNRIDTKRLRAEAPDLARLYEIESFSSRVNLI
jgi:hypothetical protein